jgi:hypothetical protein
MSLPESDVDYLRSRGLAHEVTTEAGFICIVFPAWPLPGGYNRSASDLLLRLQPGYPDVPPDMWWFGDTLTLAAGGVIEATQVMETHLGRMWQRWSRHLQPGQWKSGIDGMESYLALIARELLRSSDTAAA